MLVPGFCQVLALSTGRAGTGQAGDISLSGIVTWFRRFDNFACNVKDVVIYVLENYFGKVTALLFSV